MTPHSDDFSDLRSPTHFAAGDRPAKDGPVSWRKARQSFGYLLALSALVADTAGAQGASVAVVLGSSQLPSSAFLACHGGQTSAALAPGQSVSEFDTCTFDAHLLNPVIQTPYYVDFPGMMQAYASTSWDGTLKTKANISMSATPIGDMVGYGDIDAIGTASWQHDIFMTPTDDAFASPAQVNFIFDCHAILTPTFISGLGMTGASGRCSATIDQNTPSVVSGGCEYGAVDGHQGRIVPYGSCVTGTPGDFGFTAGQRRSLVASAMVTGAQAAGSAPLNLRFSSSAEAYANIYGGFFGTGIGVDTVVSSIHSNADLTSTMRFLGVQVLGADGTDITARYRLTADDGFVIPSFSAPTTTPEPTALALLLTPLVVLTVARARKRAAPQDSASTS